MPEKSARPRSPHFRAYAPRGWIARASSKASRASSDQFCGTSRDYSSLSLRSKCCPPRWKAMIVLNDDDSDRADPQLPWVEMSRAEVIANDVHTVVDRQPIYQAGLDRAGSSDLGHDSARGLLHHLLSGHPSAPSRSRARAIAVVVVFSADFPAFRHLHPCRQHRRARC